MRLRTGWENDSWRAQTFVPVMLGAALAAWAPSSVLAKPQPTTATPSAPMVIKVGVDLIQIDAAVTDKAGQPVSGLRPEDFTLEVDGRKVKISNAEFSGPPSAGVALVFLVDDLNISRKNMDTVKQALGQFATESDGSRARVALRTTGDVAAGLPSFETPDRFAVAASGLRYNIRSSKGLAAARPDLAFGGSGAGVPRNQALRPPASSNTPAEDLQNLQQRVFSLVATIDMLRSFPGRKAVVFVSEGFEVAYRAHEQAGSATAFNALFDDTNTRAALRMIAEVASRASVVLYTVDPKEIAVGAMPDQRPNRIEDQLGLQQLADDTGGLANAYRYEMKGGFADVLKDQGSYYLVGFEPPEGAFEKVSGRPRFHKVKLSANVKGLRVRTRAGFYGVTDGEVINRAPLITPSH